MSGFGGAKRDRTADLLHAMQALSQLSYGPTSLRSEIIAVPPGVGKRLLHFSSRPLRGRCQPPGRRCARRRNALLMTDTELRLIATAASIGDNEMPHGTSTPAATGMPSPL